MFRLTTWTSLHRIDASQTPLSVNFEFLPTGAVSLTSVLCHRGRVAAVPRVMPGIVWAVMLLTILVFPRLTWADSPNVQFDTSYAVACVDVPDSGLVTVNSDERIVEARFRISSLMAGIESPGRVQFVHRFMSPEGSLQIFDYEPKSEFTSSVVGNVRIDKTDETTKSLGINLSGSFEHLVTGSAGTDLASKNGAKIQYELKPPTEVAIVAGTVQRGTGVYFKVRPSAEAPLEGTRDFVLRMRVNQDWRGDVMYVRCIAQEEHRGRLTTFGSALFVVTLYAEGDGDVRDAGRDLARAETRLRRAASGQSRDIERRSLPTLARRLGALLDLHAPSIPDHWLDRLIFGPTDTDQHVFTRHLPADVRRLARQYGQAKQRLYEFGT